MTDNVKQFMEAFEAEFGHNTIFIVGGAVRDIVMGNIPNDYDFATSIMVEDVAEKFKTVDIGQSKNFGIVSVLWDGEAYECATFRSDGDYSDSRHPDSVKTGVTIQEDADRRDFTINGMFMASDGIIHDFNGGMADIQNQRITAIGNPGARIKEDALRMLRAIRFAAVYDYTIHYDLQQAIRDNIMAIDNIAHERITAEIIKAAKCGGEVFKRFMHVIEDLEVMPWIFPEIDRMKNFNHHWLHHPEGATQKNPDGTISTLKITDMKAGRAVLDKPGTVFDHVMSCIDQLVESDTVEIIFGVLYHDIGKPDTAVLKDAEAQTSGFPRHEHVGVFTFRRVAQVRKFSSDLRKSTEFCIKQHMNVNNQRMVKKTKIAALATDPFFETLARVAKCDDASRGPEVHDPAHFEKGIKRFRDAKAAFVDRDALKKRINLFVNGEKVMKARGIGPGKEVGLVIDKVKDFMIENDFEVTAKQIDKMIKEIEV